MPIRSFEFSVFSFQHLPLSPDSVARGRRLTENWKLETGNFLPHQLEQSRAVALRVSGGHAELSRDVVLAHLRVRDRARHHVHVYPAPPEQLYPAPCADVVRRAEDQRRRRRAKLRVFEDRLDRVAAEYSVSQFDDDEVGRTLVELRDYRLRDGREVAHADRRGQPAVHEARRRDGAVVGHVERVAQARHARELRGRDAHAGARRLTHDLGRRERLARVHARARHDDERRATLRQTLARGQRRVRDVSRLAVLADDEAEHFDLNGVAQRRVVALAAAYDPAHVQELQAPARRQLFGHVADETLQRAAAPQSADDNVAGVYLREPARRKLKLVVGGAVRERAHGDHVAPPHAPAPARDRERPLQPEPGYDRPYLVGLDDLHPERFVRVLHSFSSREPLAVNRDEI